MTLDRIVLWGTPDLGKPRARILIGGLRERNLIAGECTAKIWRGVEDKSQVKGIADWLAIILRYCLAYPVLIFRYMRAPRHDAVLVAYMGRLDVLVLWPFAKLRGARIVWDAFLSLYGTVVEDRKMIGAGHPAAWAIHSFEKLACAAADIVILDTRAHGDYFRDMYRLPERKVISVWVGAEMETFHQVSDNQKAAGNDEFNVLFYGQYIPLHGIEYIIDAARRVSDPTIKWTIIGRGQEREKIDALLAQDNLWSVKLIDWVDYAELPGMIADADLCLGIFGDSDKAARVIPNKVFQILASGKPLVTADTPGIREILSDRMPGVWLVPPASGAALAEAVVAAKSWITANRAMRLHEGMDAQISRQAIAQSLVTKLEAAFPVRP